MALHSLLSDLLRCERYWYYPGASTPADTYAVGNLLVNDNAWIYNGNVDSQKYGKTYLQQHLARNLSGGIWANIYVSNTGTTNYKDCAGSRSIMRATTICRHVNYTHPTNAGGTATVSLTGCLTTRGCSQKKNR